MKFRDVLRPWRRPADAAESTVPAVHLVPGGDPVQVAAAIGTVYPDRVEFLPVPNGPGGPDEVAVPYGVTRFVLEANAQFRQHAATARKRVEELSAGAAGLTDRADDQTRRRDQLHASWAEAQRRADDTHAALDGHVLHRGRGEGFRYLATMALLVFGDIAAGAAALVAGGEEPAFAVMVMAALGAAAVATGLLGTDLRRRYLWLRILDGDGADENPEAHRIVRKAFAVPESAHDNFLRVLKVAIAAAAGLALGTLTYRLASRADDGLFPAVAFGFFAVAVVAGSFWNAWAHLDPASITLAQADAGAADALRLYDRSPDEAIKQRAANRAGIEEALRSHENAAWSAFYQHVAAAAEYLRSNPAVAGHGSFGLGYLVDLRPADADLALFELLSDTYQVPRFTRSRPAEDPAIGTVPSDPAPVDNVTRLQQRSEEVAVEWEPSPDADEFGSDDDGDYRVAQ